MSTPSRKGCRCGFVESKSKAKPALWRIPTGMWPYTRCATLFSERPLSGTRRILQRGTQGSVVDRGDRDARCADVRSDLRLRAGNGRRGRHGDGLHADGARILCRLHHHRLRPHTYILQNEYGVDLPIS